MCRWVGALLGKWSVVDWSVVVESVDGGFNKTLFCKILQYAGPEEHSISFDGLVCLDCDYIDGEIRLA